MVSPMSSRPLSSACLRCGSMSNLTRPPSGPRISCFCEVDGQRRIGAALGVVEQFLEVLRRDLDRQHAVLEAVVVENVAERGRDHAGDAEIHERPGRVLARGAATEIVAGDQNLGLAIGRLVEHEIRIFAAVVAVAFLGEQPFAEPGALDGLQILLGDDHVGVDVDHFQRRGDAFEHGELLHFQSCKPDGSVNGGSAGASQAAATRGHGRGRHRAIQPLVRWPPCRRPTGRNDGRSHAPARA